MNATNQIARKQDFENMLKTLLTKNQLVCFKYSLTKKISGFSSEERNDLMLKIGEALVTVWNLIGLKPDNYPPAPIKKEIANFIIKYYSDMTPGEIKYAFDLAFGEVIHIETTDNKPPLEHYQSFSIPYLTRVLNAYRKYKNVSLSIAQKAGTIQTEWEEFVENRKKDSETIHKMIFSFYTEALEKKAISYEFDLSHYYDYLDFCGLITLTTEEKKHWVSEAKRIKEKEIEDYKKESLPGMYQQIKVKDMLKNLKENDLISDAKTLSFKSQLLKWVESGSTIEWLKDTLSKHCYVNIRTYEMAFEILKKIR